MMTSGGGGDGDGGAGRSSRGGGATEKSHVLEVSKGLFFGRVVSGLGSLIVCCFFYVSFGGGTYCYEVLVFISMDVG